MADTVTQVDPSAESSDYKAMKTDWQMIAAIRAGARAIKSANRTYLPQYEKESDAEYQRRLQCAPWRPEFVDALRNLCAKPFTKEVSLQGEPPKQIKDASEDIDGRGNSLHVFARDTFLAGVSMGLSAILVDFPAMMPGLTLADERKSGARPYWVHIPAENIIALYTRMVNGREVIEHIRIRECSIERAGFEEVTVHRVRVLELDEAGKPIWQLWEQGEAKPDNKTGWALKGEGAITLPEIPIVLYFTGERSDNYRVKPPLIDLAVMQIEIYNSLARKDEILTYAGSPMLVGKGMNPPEPERDENGDIIKGGSVSVGPKTILYAPPVMDGVQSEWDFIQPDAANIKVVCDDCGQLTQDFRRLALQPLVKQSGALSATEAAIEGEKSNSAVEAWATGLKDALEQAMLFTAQWMNLGVEPEVSVHTDFAVEIDGGTEIADLIKMRAAREISQETFWDECMRRGFLGPQFDPAEEKDLLENEQPPLGTMGDVDGNTIDPITGKKKASGRRTVAG